MYTLATPRLVDLDATHATSRPLNVSDAEAFAVLVERCEPPNVPATLCVVQPPAKRIAALVFW